jgi:hypothetical protein
LPDSRWLTRNGTEESAPSGPNLLLLSLERVGVRDPPEFVYREYERYITLWCKVLIFVGRSTLYPDIEPWFVSATGFCFADTYPKAARKARRRLRVIYRQHLRRTPMRFFPPSRGRGRSWIDRKRGLEREEEDLVMRTSPPTIHPRLHKIMLLLALLLVPVFVNLIIKPKGRRTRAGWIRTAEKHHLVTDATVAHGVGLGRSNTS